MLGRWRRSQTGGGVWDYSPTTDRRNENQTVSKLHLSTDCHLPIFFIFIQLLVFFSFSVVAPFCSQVNWPGLENMPMRSSEKSRFLDYHFEYSKVSTAAFAPAWPRRNSGNFLSYFWDDLSGFKEAVLFWWIVTRFKLRRKRGMKNDKSFFTVSSWTALIFPNKPKCEQTDFRLILVSELKLKKQKDNKNLQVVCKTVALFFSFLIIKFDALCR